MRVPEPIFVDRPLREFLSEVNQVVTEDPAKIGRGEAGIEGKQISGGWSGEGVLSFQRRFAGFQWTFAITTDQLSQVAEGRLKEIMMERIGPAPLGAEASFSLADGLLSSMGLDDGSVDEPQRRSAALDRTPSRELPEAPTDEEIDALLSNPEVAKLLDALGIDANAEEDEAPAQKPPAPVQPAAPAPAPAPAPALNPLAAIFGAGLDDEEPEDSVNRDQVAEATQFIELLVRGEKIELTEEPDLDRLASGLAPHLADDSERPAARAPKLIDWFLDQEAIEDVFLSDDEMARILKAW